MAIDVEKEKLIRLSEAARCVPGGPVSPNTIWRWHTRGVRDVYLETEVVGGRRLTSKEALLRFCAATTTAANARIKKPSAAQPLAIASIVDAAPRSREDGKVLRDMLAKRRRGA